MSTWLLFDANYFCHRAYHAMGDLSHDGGPTGMLFGFFQDILGYQDLFNCRNVVFAFDHLPSLRKQSYTKYKKKREEKYATATDEDRKGIDDFRRQVITLRDEYLPAIGYSNVFHAKGFEADDFIATVVAGMALQDEAIILSSDGDLDQLVDGLRIIRHNPHTRKSINEVSFREQYGLGPDQWARVKAIAGCGTDDVQGIPGCGEPTAIKYLLGTLPTHHKVYQRIESYQGQMVIERNMELVRLPYPGTPEVTLQPDSLSLDKWRAFCDSMGFTSLRSYDPAHRRNAIRQPQGMGLV